MANVKIYKYHFLHFGFLFAHVWSVHIVQRKKVHTAQRKKVHTAQRKKVHKDRRWFAEPCIFKYFPNNIEHFQTSLL